MSKARESREKVESLGVRLSRRQPPEYSLPPAQRRAISLAKEPKETDPFLADADYRHILKVMGSASKTMEMSPQTFQAMPEESLRNVLLVMLNTHYEMRATGETFNGKGKTDILVREGERNLFVAECKVWDGASVLTEGIDQLLGYVTWRDTRTALVVFSNRKSFSKVIREAVATVEKHPSFVSLISEASETEFLFEMRNAADSERLFLMTLQLFNVLGQTKG